MGSAATAVGACGRTARLAGGCLAAALLLAAAARPVGEVRAQTAEAICVDGGQSGEPFAGVACTQTVASLAEAAKAVAPGGRIVVRAFTSADENSIEGTGTYRDEGLRVAVMVATRANPTIIEAEDFSPDGGYAAPIISGAARVTADWTRTPATEATWQTPWASQPGSGDHSDCIDRIWVSRQPGRTALANFPLTRPMFNQGNDYPADCEANTVAGEPLGPEHVDAFPGSYAWLDNILYVHLPGGEDPNGYTIEVPVRHSMWPGRGSAGLVVRGFRVYHTRNGIDLWHCGNTPEDRCEATHNETSYNTPFGLQPGKYGLLAYNRGVLNTIQLIKITSDFAEIAYNVAGPQLAHGFKLHKVRDCSVHDNVVFGNRLAAEHTATQAGWQMINTRDIVAGIYLRDGTQRCTVSHNLLVGNRTGILVRNDGEVLTRDNLLEGNRLLHNTWALTWRDAELWTYNLARGNVFSAGAQVRWGDEVGGLRDFQAATGMSLGK